MRPMLIGRNATDGLLLRPEMRRLPNSCRGRSLPVTKGTSPTRIVRLVKSASNYIKNSHLLGLANIKVPLIQGITKTTAMELRPEVLSREPSLVVASRRSQGNVQQ